MPKYPKLGKPEIICQGGYGRAMVKRTLTLKPEQQIEYYLWWFTKRHPCMICAVTKDYRIVVTKQFRAGSGKSILEFPGGTPRPGEQGEKAVARELREEAGFKPERIVNLNIAPWTDGPSCNTHVHFYMGLNAKKVSRPARDPMEPTEVVLVPIPTWYEMIFRGEVECSKTIALSLLALPYVAGTLKFK